VRSFELLTINSTNVAPFVRPAKRIASGLIFPGGAVLPNTNTSATSTRPSPSKSVIRRLLGMRVHAACTREGIRVNSCSSASSFPRHQRFLPLTFSPIPCQRFPIRVDLCPSVVNAFAPPPIPHFQLGQLGALFISRLYSAQFS
jgi:hypothetical protein